MLRPKEVVCKWVDAFNNHDVEAIVSLYHDNATNHQVTNDPVIGIDAIREMFTTEFATADMTAIVENIFEDGQWAILEWKDPLGLRGCGFFHVVNGKILFQRGYWDKLSFLKQHLKDRLGILRVFELQRIIFPKNHIVSEFADFLGQNHQRIGYFRRGFLPDAGNKLQNKGLVLEALHFHAAGCQDSVEQICLGIEGFLVKYSLYDFLAVFQ